ncbi:hypothetical protein [Halorientalis halophila]|uniref:hypothetical protein n=1 Tax=Halorientalis halophila TaxID=3108499 RepID=UPI00300A64A8
MSPDDQHEIYETEKGYLQKSPYPTEGGYPEEPGYPTEDGWPDTARVVGDADWTQLSFADGEEVDLDVGIDEFVAELVAESDDDEIRLAIDADLVTAYEE